MTTTFYNHWRDVPADAWRWKNFSPAEIACRGTGKLIVNEVALDRLQALRDALGNPSQGGADPQSGAAAPIPLRCAPQNPEVPARQDPAADPTGEARPLLLLPRHRLQGVRPCRALPLQGRANKAVVVGDDYPVLLRARRPRERWTDEDRRLYQRHRWRSEGYHCEAKTWHGLARAVRRSLPNMKIQAYLTAAAVNLKRSFPGLEVSTCATSALVMLAMHFQPKVGNTCLSSTWRLRF